MNLYYLESANNDFYYVVATNPTEAEEKVREWLTSLYKTSLQYTTFIKIELIASTGLSNYSNVLPLFI